MDRYPRPVDLPCCGYASGSPQETLDHERVCPDADVFGVRGWYAVGPMEGWCTTHGGSKQQVVDRYGGHRVEVVTIYLTMDGQWRCTAGHAM